MQNAGMSKFGVMVMSGFAAIWFIWGLSALGSAPAGLLVVPVAISGTLIALASRIPMRASDEARRRTGKVVGWASGIEGVAIFLAANVLNWTGHSAFFPIAVAAIVGLHFLPLAYFLAVRSYYVTGAAIVALAFASCAIGDEAARLLVVGIGTAVILWVNCLGIIVRKVEPAVAA